ncbi:Paf1 domain-containing protein [Cephalotus follicularis]|uniref:Paf1 domain-containing protein n=1 Tax=Cephalotus follicularis TaxID=3775 RepID=A0A1Q3AZX0_CEPFO|nr:Paf1 domain-containing protein [Cephalotus follicularis]
MASYRPFPPPPQPSFPPPPTQQLQPTQRPTQYTQNWNYTGAGAGAAAVADPSSFPPPPPQPQMAPTSSNYNFAPSRPPQYSYPPPPPPPPDSSYPPPPPPPPPSMPLQPPQQPPPMYYPTSQPYSNQYSHQQLQPLQPPLPPPPPSSPPPSSSIPPPPPPTSPSPPPKESGLNEHDEGVSKNVPAAGVGREHGSISKQQRPPFPQAVKKANGLPGGRVETEEERRMRKKREYEKQRHEEKHRQMLKESQNTVLQKTQMSSGKGPASISGSRMGDRRAAPLLGGERIENRLKKPTTFLCKLKFRNELPDPSAQPKLMALKRDKDQYTKYTITSLEKMYKPQLFVEPDLGIPLDLLDLSVYNRPSVIPPLDPEDEELLRDDEAATPVKKDGIRRKERPTDKGVSWLVKTQYISPLSMESAKQSLTEKQAKELREMRGGRNILENLNNRERQIKEIEASFEASKLRPVHATNKNLRPVEVLPLLPDFERLKDKFVVVAFDGAPTVDSEIYGKLDQSLRDAYESQAVMKSFVAKGSDSANQEKFLAYMTPSLNELSKDMFDENEDISFSWIREYNWDVRGEDEDDPTTYLVSFDESEARYAPLPTKLNLKKKRAREGRPNDEIEHFPIPSKVTVRRRSTAAAIELQDSEVYSNSRASVSSRNFGRLDAEDGLERPQAARHQDDDQYSGAEDDLSD